MNSFRVHARIKKKAGCTDGSRRDETYDTDNIRADNGVLLEKFRCGRNVKVGVRSFRSELEICSILKLAIYVKIYYLDVFVALRRYVTLTLTVL